MTLAKTPTVALVGNPNTGKTTLFNALAGMRQRVGNYPGVTVETKKGHLVVGDRPIDLIDLPGTYSLAPRSPDEMVTVDLVLGEQPNEPRPDVVLSIVDASNLERNLYLTTQVLELGVPVVLALNMIDVAESMGVRIDAQRLERQLGVRVVPIQANKGRGLDVLKKALVEAIDGPPPPRMPAFPEAFDTEALALAKQLATPIGPFLLRRALLDVGGQTEQRLIQREGDACRRAIEAARVRLTTAGCPVPNVEARTRYAWLREMTAGCIERPKERRATWTDRLDRVLTHRILGTLIFLGLMFLMFQSIFVWALPGMKLIGIGQGALADWLRGLMAPGPLNSLLTDGIVGGVGSVIVFLPQIIILFGFIAVLEDCGYMARAAFLMDRLMARCGLSGKSFIPMLSSVACAVPGIMATRVIEDRRDRLATILVAPLMSCSARLPVYILLIATFLTTGYPWWLPGLTMFGMYLIGIILAPVVALVLKRSLLRGEAPVFVMEMPVYKVPSVRTVLRRVIDSAAAFLRRAGTMILAAMVLVWALLYFPRHKADGTFYDVQVAELQESVDREKAEVGKLEAGEAKQARQEAVEAEEKRLNALQAEWKRQSYLGQMGRTIEPVVRPLGWDWKIGMAALASFPAREVVVGTLGIIYGEGKVESDEIRAAQNAGDTPLGQALRSATWDDDPERKVYSVPVALSLMVFFALCCQCASTLAVIRRETNGWGWPAFTLLYMTTLAYVGALATYQIGRWF